MFTKTEENPASLRVISFDVILSYHNNFQSELLEFSYIVGRYELSESRLLNKTDPNLQWVITRNQSKKIHTSLYSVY